jgi:hypothetical protein
MRASRLFLMILSLGGVAAAFAATKPSAFGNQSKPLKATVRILAISSSSRQSFAGNQDIYLADVQIKGGDHRFARVIDQYPGFGLPIRVSLMRDRTEFTMQVTREPECDVPGAKVFLRAGDASIFDGSVRDSLATHAADAIPCFRSVHQSIQIGKKQ